MIIILYLISYNHVEKKNFAISSELIQKLHNLIQKVSQNSNESNVLQMSRKAAQLHPKKKRKFYPIKLIQKITIQISLKKKKSHSNLITRSKMLEYSQKNYTVLEISRVQ